MKSVTSRKGTGRAAATRPVELHITVTRSSGDIERYLLATGASREWANEIRKRVQRIHMKLEKAAARIEKVQRLHGRRVKAA